VGRYPLEILGPLCGADRRPSATRIALMRVIFIASFLRFGKLAQSPLAH
jgi:hypothetical protein